jgi:hypothetical protein
MRSISIRAVLIGGISDIVLSNLLGIPLAIYVISSGGLSQLPKDQLQGAVVSAMHANPGLFAAQLGIGYVCSIAGGFIAAWIAKDRRLLNGILASWLCVGLGVYSFVSGKVSESLQLTLVLIALTPFAYALGAWIKISVSRRRSASI